MDSYISLLRPVGEPVKYGIGSRARPSYIYCFKKDCPEDVVSSRNVVPSELDQKKRYSGRVK